MMSEYDYVVAIPSYKREHSILKKTLTTLEDNRIEPSTVFVFVADEEEMLKYSCSFWDGRSPYARQVHLILGVPTLKGQRNFIRQFFKQGQRILNLDDDIKRIRLLTRKGATYLPDKWSRDGVREYTSDGYDYVEGSYTLDEHVRHGFKLCEKYGSYIFGFAPNKSPLALGFNVRKDTLLYLEGSAWGSVNRQEESLDITVDDDKEDFERSVQHWELDGQIIRLDYVGIDTAFWTEGGGMQNTRTQERAEAMAEYMAKKYPWVCSTFKKFRPVSGESHWTSKGYIDIKLSKETKEQRRERRQSP